MHACGCMSPHHPPPPQPPKCDPTLGNCGTWVAIPFFISFVLLVSIVMLNLFTAVIIENFEKQQV
jgi:hypothetical protein